MTVVVAALNKQAVALAADSAVTIGTGRAQKIFNSGNKIFSLSREHPVAAAVWGGAELNGFPWETVLKEYRRECGGAECATVKDYAEQLLHWLDTSGWIAAGAGTYIRDEVGGEFEQLLVEAQALARTPTPSPAHIEQASAAAAEHYRLAAAPQGAPADLGTKIRAEHGRVIDDQITVYFDTYDPSPEMRERLVEVAVGAVSKFPRARGNGATGLLVTGLGSEQMLPAATSWEIAGVACDYALRRRVRAEDEVISSAVPSLVLPFAQAFDVYAFLTGVHPAYQKVVEETITGVVKDLPLSVIDALRLPEPQASVAKEQAASVGADVLNSVLGKLKGMRDEEYSEPIYRVVAALPKEDLAMMVETLCNITSFKRRVSEGDETVGGPVDVALISRGDGFVWIKRKHYFSTDLNPFYAPRTPRMDSE